MRNTWINDKQYVAISVNTLFRWWDYLDALENEPELCKKLFYDFLEQCEDTLELHPDLIEEMEKLEEGDFVPLTTCRELFYTKEQLDIPFSPRHNF